MCGMKKILIILTPGFPSNEKDTTTMYSQQLFVKIVAEEFPEVIPIVISLHYPYTKKKYRWFGTEVIPLNGMKHPRWLRLIPWIQAWKQLGNINRNYQISGILSFWCHESALIGKWFSRRNKIRHLIWILGQDARKSNWLVKFIRPSSDNLVSISEWITHEFEKNHHIRPSFYIPNGIAVEDFSPNLMLKSIDIIGVGSLVAIKQYTVFIDVVASIALSYPNLRVELCGAGKELALLKDRVDKLGLTKMINFQGELPHPGVLQKMQKSKILLHPSSYEGYSTACLEALYAGCHVVSFTKAEDNPIANWHSALDIQEMTETCLRILSQYAPPQPQMIHSMRDSVKAMIALLQQPG